MTKGDYSSIWIKTEDKKRFEEFQKYGETQSDTLRKIMAYAVRGGLKPYYMKI